MTVFATANYTVSVIARDWRAEVENGQDCWRNGGSSIENPVS